jgi:hypothetical protein
VLYEIGEAAPVEVCNGWGRCGLLRCIQREFRSDLGHCGGRQAKRGTGGTALACLPLSTDKRIATTVSNNHFPCLAHPISFNPAPDQTSQLHRRSDGIPCAAPAAACFFPPSRSSVQAVRKRKGKKRQASSQHPGSPSSPRPPGHPCRSPMQRLPSQGFPVFRRGSRKPAAIATRATFCAKQSSWPQAVGTPGRAPSEISRPLRTRPACLACPSCLAQLALQQPSVVLLSTRPGRHDKHADAHRK